MKDSKLIIDTVIFTDNQEILEATDKLYNSLCEIVRGKKLTTENTMQVALSLMKFVERYPDLQGSQKKFLVIQVLKRFVKNSMGVDENEDLLTFIDVFLPTVIDSVISVDKKQFVINIKKDLKKCLPCY